MRFSDKVWNPQRPEVPVDANGNWLAYPGYNDNWVEVRPFWAVLKITGMETGRSAKRAVLVNVETGTRYPMFVSDLIDCIKKGLVDVKGDGEDGYLTGLWSASKRGANYGIKAVKRSDD